MNNELLSGIESPQSQQANINENLLNPGIGFRPRQGSSNSKHSKQMLSKRSESNNSDEDEEEDKFEDTEEQIEEDDMKFPLFLETSKLFQFRSTLKVGKRNAKHHNHLVKKGQYEFPFTFTIPSGHPSSF